MLLYEVHIHSTVNYIVHTRVLYIIYGVSSPADGGHARFRGCGRHQGTLYIPDLILLQFLAQVSRGRKPRPDLTHEAINLFLHAWGGMEHEDQGNRVFSSMP